MKQTKQKLVLIFTRDFCQWINQMLRDGYVLRFPRIWGKGLKDQIVHYTGRSTELYRYRDDYKALGEYMAHKELGASIFQAKTHSQFRKDVAQLKKLITISPKHIKNTVAHLSEIKTVFERMYPIYTLSVFLPGPWREQFLKVHGNKSKTVLARVFKSRELSEGIAKRCDIYLREWLGHLVKKFGYPRDYFKLLSVEEVDTFVQQQILPSRHVLDARAKEYVYINGKIKPIDNFEKFLTRQKLVVPEKPKEGVRELKGVVACPGGLITGSVWTIFNSAEVSKFKKGHILVTPMTSPEYVSAMKKAVAIVTDEGGLTCHAAIVSRELNIPCVIGTKIATRVFKDGDMVEVDATKGIAKIIK